MEVDETALEGFFPRCIICKFSVQNYLLSRSLCSFSQATYLDATQSRAAKRCRIEHRKLENSLTKYCLEENEDGSNAEVREKKKKNCIFLTITDGFLILQYPLVWRQHNSHTSAGSVFSPSSHLAEKGKAVSHAYTPGREDTSLSHPPETAASPPFFPFLF